MGFSTTKGTTAAHSQFSSSKVPQHKAMKKKRGLIANLSANYDPYMPSDHLAKRISSLESAYFKRIDPDGVLVTKNNRYQDWYLILGYGLRATSIRQGHDLIDDFYFYLKAMVPDSKIITSKYPTETPTQQSYWRELQHRAENNVLRATAENRLEDISRYKIQAKYALQKVNDAQAAERNLSNKEFMLVFEAPTKKQLQMEIDDAKQFGGKAITLEKISIQKKENKVFQFRNMNASLHR